MSRERRYDAPRVRVIHKRCGCGCLVPFTVWPGFKPVAEHLAGRCAGCRKVHTLKGESHYAIR